MGSLFFFAKMMVITIFVILMMQIRIGKGTLEEHAMSWTRQSSLLEPVREVAHGGLIVIREGWQRVTGQIDTPFWNSTRPENQPGKRDLIFKLERSRAYIEQKTREAARQAKGKAEELKQELEAEWEGSASHD